MIRKIFQLVNQILVFIGFRKSENYEVKDIVYMPWSGKRNSIKDDKKTKKDNVSSDRTIVLTNYIPPKDMHHSKEGFSYQISDRSCKRWTDDEWFKAEKLKEKGMTNKEIAKELNRSEESVRKKIQYMNKKK